MLTQHFDLAFVSLQVFWLFFAGLVFYLLRENKREGYPLESDRSDKVRVQGWPPIPPPKAFVTAHHGAEVPSRVERDLTGLAVPASPFLGAPLVPTGNPMKDGIGPASWAARADVPDVTFDQQLPKIVPLRAAEGYYLDENDPDPRGMTVVCADGRAAGTVVDAWVDRSETLVRYLEAETTAAGGGTRRVVFPTALAVVDARRREVRVNSVIAAQFAEAPGIKNPEQITLLEEDVIQGYFGGGHMYATPQRLGPLL